MSISHRLAQLLKAYGYAAYDRIRDLDLGVWDGVVEEWRGDSHRGADLSGLDRDELEAAMEELERELAAERLREEAEGARRQRDNFRRYREERQKSRRTTAPTGTDLAAHYKVLGLAVGADFKAVKSRYRALMRQVHPDLNATGDPIKQRQATEKSQRITAAYRALEAALRRPSSR